MFVDTGWVSADSPFSGSDNRRNAYNQRCNLYRYLKKKGSRYWTWSKLKTVRVNSFELI